ncbi:MAG: CBS domain-containing protein [Thermoproteota archaeon]|nr:CBS domain-containing protein [Thermoproteota archaeon]
MSDLGIRSRMIVKDVMSSPVTTIYEDETVQKAAQLMDRRDIGCIIVISKKGKPLGIITERDLVHRVLAKNALASGMTAKEVMTSPLITVDPDETLSEVARRMSRLNVRRLGVIYKGNLVGVISSKDVLAVTPELIEILQERVRIESENTEEEVESSPLAGYCDRCSRWSDNLKEFEGQFLCEDCLMELRTEY